MVRDVETAPISDSEKALLRFIEKVNGESPTIGRADIEALYQHGWNDEAIYDAIMARDPAKAKAASQNHIDFVAAATREAERTGEWNRIARLRLQQRDRAS